MLFEGHSPSFSAPLPFGTLALDVAIISGPKSFARQEATSANKNGYHGQASLFWRIRICGHVAYDMAVVPEP